MTARALAQRLGAGPLDAALVVALLVLGYWNLWVDWDSYFPAADPHLLIDSLTIAVATLALLGRRRAPVAVLIIVNAAQFGPDLLVPTGPVFWGEWVPSLVAAYSVAVYRGGRWSALPFLAAIGSLTVFAWRYPLEFAGVTSATVWVAPVVVAVAAGHGISKLRSSSTELAGRAEALERSQVERAERAAAEERARIARELHDVIAHNVSIMVVQASAAEDTLAVDQAAATRAMQHVQTAGREALEEMRLLLGVLRDDAEAGSRAPVPSLHRLDTVIEPMRRAGLDVTLVASGLDQRIPPAVDVSAYRVIQEALTNSLKHAAGSKVLVTVKVEPRSVRVDIRDGGGDQRNEAGSNRVRGNGELSGHGLLGLRERVALHGGTFHAAAEPDGGFTLRAELPITADAAP